MHPTSLDPLKSRAAELVRSPDVETLLRLALREDIGAGDVTTEHLVPAGRRVAGTLRARQDGVVAGLPIAERLRELAGADYVIEPAVSDGDAVAAGATIARVSGRARDILTTERVLLNLLQRLSGIATLTRRYVDAVAAHACAILETRKTVPGWRALDKYAVLAGGGENHRQGLFDAILAKENHFALGDGGGSPARLRAAVDALLAARPDGLATEVEVESLDELDALLDAGLDIILLDNMPAADLRRAVARRNERGRRPLLEASGGITLANVAEVAATGVDRISVGALTHSVQAFDLSLLLDA